MGKMSFMNYLTSHALYTLGFPWQFNVFGFEVLLFIYLGSKDLNYSVAVHIPTDTVSLAVFAVTVIIGGHNHE